MAHHLDDVKNIANAKRRPMGKDRGNALRGKPIEELYRLSDTSAYVNRPTLWSP